MNIGWTTTNRADDGAHITKLVSAIGQSAIGKSGHAPWLMLGYKMAMYTSESCMWIIAYSRFSRSDSEFMMLLKQRIRKV